MNYSERIIQIIEIKIENLKTKYDTTTNTKIEDRLHGKINALEWVLELLKGETK